MLLRLETICFTSNFHYRTSKIYPLNHIWIHSIKYPMLLNYGEIIAAIHLLFRKQIIVAYDTLLFVNPYLCSPLARFQDILSLKFF